MALFKEEKRPFEEINKTEPTFTQPLFEAEVQRSGISHRSAMLLSASIFSLDIIWTLSEKLLLSLGIFGAYVLLWFCIIRFTQSRRLAPLNFVVNFLIAGSVTVIPVVSDDPMVLLGLIPMAAAFCFLGNECDEGRAMFTIQPFLTIGYVLFACMDTALAYIVMTLLDVRSVSVMLLLSVAILILAEIAMDKLFGSEILISSKLPISKDSTPIPTRDTLEKFVSQRLIFVGYLLVSLAVMMGVEYLIPENNMFMSYARFGGIVIVAVLFMLCLRKLRIWYEPALAMIMFLRADTLIIFLLAMVVDAMIAGFYVAAPRKELTMPSSRYLAGIPRMLTVAAFFVAITECCIN